VSNIIVENKVLKKTSKTLTNIRDYIRWSVSLMNENNVFFGHGSENSWDEAVHLVLSALHLKSIEVDKYMLDAVLTQEERLKIIHWVYQRVYLRKPLSYIIKKAWFAEMEFDIDERVLIPRSPIAELIYQSFSPWVNSPEKVANVLDLCTGSGCIGIACSTAFENANITLVDISDDAIDVANINIKKHHLEHRVKTVKSDLFTNLKGQKFDVIVSNPPYVDSGDLASMPKEFEFEPKIGLKAGNDGLDFAKKIILEAPTYMTENAVLIVEVGNSQYALMELCSDVAFTWLSFENGGDGVFLLSYNELIEYREKFEEYFLK